MIESKNENYQGLLQILKEGVKPALGCTEPAAVGLATAKALALVKGPVERVKIKVSPNIFKNGMRVGIPGTEEKGLVFATALAIACGDADLGLEVFQGVNAKAVCEAKKLIKAGMIHIEVEYNRRNFYIEACVNTGKGKGFCIIEDSHTNITLLKANEEIVFSKGNQENNQGESKEKTLEDISLKSIREFIEKVDFSQIEFLLEGSKINMDIARVGLEKQSGAGLGSALNRLALEGKIQMDMMAKARILTSAACDARMAGVEMPVMSTSGSGNQGLTAIIPPTVVCEYLGLDEERQARTLAFSHLITAYTKRFVGKLSPICGCAVAAGIGACASITWVLGGGDRQIAGAIKNMVGSLAGMVCDGAKGGCAFKISTAATESILQAQLAMENVFINDLDGIVSPGVEKTIKNLGKFCSDGMKEADGVIISIMLENDERGESNVKGEG